MKTLTSKSDFFAIAEKIFKNSSLKFIAVLFTQDGEFVVRYNNYESLAKAKFYANQMGSNSWTYDKGNGLLPA